MILDIIAFLCLIVAFVLLITLSVIDLKIGLLPNIYNALFALTGLAFHGLTEFLWLDIHDLALGALVGGGMLFIVRLAANFLYKADTLGLGDVKLLAAAGVWLGPQGILLAITAGAFAGVHHGAGALLASRNKDDSKPISHISIPAGPGFAVGIVIAGAYQYWPFIKIVFREVF